MDKLSGGWQHVVQEGYGWAAEVFVVVVLTLLAHFVAVRVLYRLQLQLQKTKNLWDDILLESMSRPVAYLIWVIGIAWAAELVDKQSGTSILLAVSVARDVLIIVLLAMFVVRFIKQVELKLVVGANVDTEEGIDETTIMAIGRLLRAAVIITAVLVILQSLGYSIQGVLAFGGIGGIAVGFAAKDLLANFFGGLMIYMDRPFSVGDWVRSPDKEIEGTVEHIGWRLTRIRTFDKRPLYVPNAVFTHIAVENPSRMENRRIFETIGLRYDDADQLADIVNSVRAMLQTHPEIDNTKTLIVNFNTFSSSSLDFFVYTFTKTTEWVYFHKIKEDVLLKILHIISEHGADMAYPTSTVKLPDGLLVNHQNEEFSGDDRK